MQKTTFHQREFSFSSMFSPLRLVLLLGLLYLILPANSVAQTYIDCDQITPSPVDKIIIQRVEGRPGDTVWVPFSVKTDRPMSGFRMLVTWDSTKVYPILDYGKKWDI